MQKFKHYFYSNENNNHARPAVISTKEELNPVEIIWADVKSCIMWHNITFTLQDVWNLYEKKLSNKRLENWLSKCTHAKLT